MRNRHAMSAHPDLLDTQRAFDSVAADYDGPRGNNALIQRMRDTMWREFETRFATGERVIDLGCGTGIDAVHLASRGRRVLATDWSPAMVERTTARAATAGVHERVEARCLGAHQLAALGGSFDGAYSNFGPLNCVPDMGEFAWQCGRLLRPGGHLVASVIGRICPWEYLYYRFRRPERARIRRAVGPVAVQMNGHAIWTTYYRPMEFAAHFRADFEVVSSRALSLFLPPPYLVKWQEKFPRVFAALGRLDDFAGRWPVLRNAGDHF